jgi:uncharacterized protein
MKFQPETTPGVNLIQRQDATGLWVAGQQHARSVLVPWRGAVLPWPAAQFGQLTAEHFENILALAPEVVIFGSGSRLRFPPAALLRSLIAWRIGVETMDTAAACRTFNVLVSELRPVVAALLVEPEDP